MELSSKYPRPLHLPWVLSIDNRLRKRSNIDAVMRNLSTLFSLANINLTIKIRLKRDRYAVFLRKMRFFACDKLQAGCR